MYSGLPILVIGRDSPDQENDLTFFKQVELIPLSFFVLYRYGFHSYSLVILKKRVGLSVGWQSFSSLNLSLLYYLYYKRLAAV